MKFAPFLLIAFFCYSSSINAQVVLKQHSTHNHDSKQKHGSKHQHDSHDQHDSYHCGACNTHLFDADEATIVGENVLHYHGIATEESQSSFHCAACQSHLGYFNHEDSTYQVINNKIGEGDSQFYCAACQFPLFNSETLASKGESSSFFSEPIHSDRIKLDDRKKFYKIDGPNAVCGRCNSRFGDYNKNGSGGFGLRINLGPLGGKN